MKIFFIKISNNINQGQILKDSNRLFTKNTVLKKVFQKILIIKKIFYSSYNFKISQIKNKKNKFMYLFSATFF